MLINVKLLEGTFKMNKTFELWNEESRNAGDTDDRGFDYEDKEFDSLWEVAKEIRDNGASEVSSSDLHPGTWYSTDPEIDYQSGEETIYAFHPQDLDEKQTQLLHKLIQMDFETFTKLGKQIN